MFAIIDIETTGGKAGVDRITDICVVLHDGLVVTETYSTLINPEKNINYFITKLTGITNEMVANAPKFWEVAKKIVELTEGRVFVAHNVRFDYGFVEAEFAALGYKFKRDKLCTVKLSRQLLPKRKSYSLGNLCEELGIPNSARHRAEGDAVATAQLFNILLEAKANHPTYKNKGVIELNVTKIDKIKEYILKKLPEEAGVYYFLNADKEIIYVGKSKNMYQRAIAHFGSKELKSKKMLHDLMNVDYVATGSELVALLLEANEIRHHKPTYNRAKKASEFTHYIDWYFNEQEVIEFKIVDADESMNAIASFTTISSARERLDTWIDEYSLCLARCHLTPADSVCFNHQIKKCKGICNGTESPREYNERAVQILEKYNYEHANFLLIDKGRELNEKSIILIKDNKYIGYGYIDDSVSISDHDELLSYIKKQKYYPDNDDLIRSYLKSNKLKRIVLPNTKA